MHYLVLYQGISNGMEHFSTDLNCMGDAEFRFATRLEGLCQKKKYEDSKFL